MPLKFKCNIDNIYVMYVWIIINIIIKGFIDNNE